MVLVIKSICDIQKISKILGFIKFPHENKQKLFLIVKFFYQIPSFFLISFFILPKMLFSTINMKTLIIKKNNTTS